MNQEALLVRQILNAQTPAEIARVLRNLGFSRLFWQQWRPTEIDTWDAMPDGFLEHYYGINADQYCAVAKAIHSHWRSYTFQEARRTFGSSPMAQQAEAVWRAFGAEDGVVLMTGRGERPSATILATSRPAEPLFQAYYPALTFAACRLDTMLSENRELQKVSRALLQLSEKQMEVLRVQIHHPDLSFAEQAKMLGISPRTLVKRHQQIAERFGVSSFAGAVAKASSRTGGLPEPEESG